MSEAVNPDAALQQSNRSDEGNRKYQVELFFDRKRPEMIEGRFGAERGLVRVVLRDRPPVRDVGE